MRELRVHQHEGWPLAELQQRVLTRELLVRPVRFWPSEER
jgi:hypothetical protein